MKVFLAKKWFLILLIGGVCLALWLPQPLRPYTEKIPPRPIVVCALFLMSWTLNSRNLIQSMVRPLPALWAVLISYGLLPPLGWLAGRLVPDTDYRIGLLIITSVPCTLASAVLWTRMAGGNDATALLVILLSNGTSWLVTTAWLALATGTQTRLDALALMQDLAMVLLVPIGLGQLCRASSLLARMAARGKIILDVIAQLLILAIILKAVVALGEALPPHFPLSQVGDKGRFEVSPGGIGAALGLSLGLHLLGLAVGLWSSRGLKFDRPNQIAVAFAGSQKTLPVALLLLDRYFKDYPLAVVPLICYHVGQLIADTFIADWLAGQESRQVELTASAGI